MSALSSHDSSSAHPNTLLFLSELQELVGEGNAKRGFHAEGDVLRRMDDAFPVVTTEGGTVEAPRASAAFLRNYYITKLALIVTEAAEAVEELRKGMTADQAYYSDTDGATHETPYDSNNLPRKPEGVPSELADVVIRCFDFAHEAGLSLGEAILEKLDYNDTRPYLHGKEM